MSYAILRFAKLSNKTGKNSIHGSAKHNFREQITENADFEKTQLNQTKGAQSSFEVLEKLNERLKTVPTVRKNAVIAVEYFIGMSPEFVKDGGDIEGYFDKAETWLKEKHGEENIIAITRQYDETTPHICAYIVPIDGRGRLNASAFFDGSKALTDMQTDFAEKCGKPYGLERGIEKSGATHQTIREYYAKIQAPTPELKTEIPAEPEPATMRQKLAEAAGLQTDHSRAEAERIEALQKRNEEITAQREAEKAKAKQYDIERRNSVLRSDELKRIRERATEARDLPLRIVLEALGCHPELKDRKNWKTPTGRITLDEPKFFNHDTGKGGGGAIDLVIEQTGTDYRGAVNWLSTKFGSDAVLSESLARLKPQIEEISKEKNNLDQFKLHEPVSENWEKAKNYLIETRKLDIDLVDKIHKEGNLYADKFNNLVFVLMDKKGLSLRGTGDNPFHGVRGKKMPFVLNPRKLDPTRAAFVESPIDALSLRQLGFNGCIVATVGNPNESISALAETFKKKGFVLLAAFDNDKAGDSMAKILGECERIRPSGKDWNDDLKNGISHKNLIPKQEIKKEIQREKDKAIQKDSGMSR